MPKEGKKSKKEEKLLKKELKTGKAPNANVPDGPRLLFGQMEVPSGFLSVTGFAILVAILVSSCRAAYNIRMHAINEYGPVIHEFDPWFNFRATQYLADNGWYKFFHWFDYQSWYPLGRPVGTTIYPGMQITAVCIWRVLDAMGMPWELNDVCAYMPCWFGVLATLFLGLLTYECYGSFTAAVISCSIMAIIPAHIMRSVGGGYDNEAIAVTAICATFYFWVRSLRNKESWPFGVLTGLAYVYMVAAWGGFVFVLNMIGIHAAVIVGLGFLGFGEGHTTKMHRAYSLFFVIGTFGAIHVPPVGMTPFKSLEQLGPLGVFAGLQILEFIDVIRRKNKLDEEQTRALRIKVITVLIAAASILIAIVLPSGYFAPLSSRVRGLFVKHTRTGNPLVDSVAEHQPASADAYWQYLHYCVYMAPVGTVMTGLRTAKWTQGSFMVLYSIIAYFFSSKMARLIIIAGPVASSTSGIMLGGLTEWAIEQFWWPKEGENPRHFPADRNPLIQIHNMAITAYKTPGGQLARKFSAGVFFFLVLCTPLISDFQRHADMIARSTSNPQIVFKGQLRDGSMVTVDDYREAYWFLRDNTPEDSRVMAWWDYGYQITGIANRTTIADGNTWNHEHIATLGRTLTAPVKEAHRIIQHLADYVLVWAGGGGDDMAKSPHLARIANSVYEGVCPGDPTCQLFGFNRETGAATPMMKASLLYQLHQHGENGVTVDPALFQEAFRSKYGKVRIFKVMDVDEESKAWVADPANKICDAPGSWYCTGQYPPGIDWLISQRISFAQLEDFNKKRDSKAERYHKEYMARMAGASPMQSGRSAH